MGEVLPGNGAASFRCSRCLCDLSCDIVILREPIHKKKGLGENNGSQVRWAWDEAIGILGLDACGTQIRLFEFAVCFRYLDE